jgi:hypothetical protein
VKDVKLKERLENAFEAFFDDAKANENNSLECVTHETALVVGENAFFSENTHKIFNILRQLLLFLPASFLLFTASVAATARFILLEGDDVITFSFLSLVLLSVLSLLTILGMGDLRKPKHLSIPFSIISIGVILGAVGTFFFDWFGFGNFLFNYVPYFFPIAFIVPILVKNWLDQENY